MDIKLRFRHSDLKKTKRTNFHAIGSLPLYDYCAFVDGSKVTLEVF